MHCTCLLLTQSGHLTLHLCPDLLGFNHNWRHAWTWDYMRRRDLITVLAGSAVAWPMRATAQQREQIRRIAILLPSTADDPVFQARLAAFYRELALLGWSIGRNVRIDALGHG